MRIYDLGVEGSTPWMSLNISFESLGFHIQKCALFPQFLNFAVLGVQLVCVQLVIWTSLCSWHGHSGLQEGCVCSQLDRIEI